eukprot:gb/GECG01010660.1/.p1 GENE.gb/GECG01010660.1/~~gb/GECG01010660.1/.p1  ORF type:complete len:395 (+),score=41.76 gb/GECG01010660.1/:1-1185(+)
MRLGGVSGSLKWTSHSPGASFLVYYTGIRPSWSVSTPPQGGNCAPRFFTSAMSASCGGDSVQDNGTTPIHLYSNHAEDTPELQKLTQGLADTPVERPSDHSPISKSQIGLFDIQRYYDTLNTESFGRNLLFQSVSSSTQKMMQKYFPNGAPSGTIWVAEQQTHGIGRASNSWVSTPGCLMFSFSATFPTSHGAQLPLIQHLISVAAVAAIRELECVKSSGIANEIQIKWPNDVYANQKHKVGGIICSSQHNGDCFTVLTGMGINVRNVDPYIGIADLVDQSSADTLSPAELLARILNSLERRWQSFCRDGLDSFRDEYESMWLHSKQRVLSQAGTTGSNRSDARRRSLEEKQLTILHLSDTGSLLAKDDSGQLYDVYPDGNTFDFMSGLIRRKI